jgi:hypothetical protein
MRKSPIIQPRLHRTPRQAQELTDLSRGIVLLDHRATLQVNPAKKNAGAIAQAKSQA